jgi:hypothetical protein
MRRQPASGGPNPPAKDTNMNDTLVFAAPARSLRRAVPKIRYFAYGANMNPEQMRARCANPAALGPARLPGHALAFHGYDWLWDGGMATVVPVPGHDLWGVLYELGHGDADSLDAWQDIRLNGTGAYFHSPVTVFAPDGEGIEAVLYKKDLLGRVRPPSREFVRFIRRGAEAHGLPDAYVAEIGALPCVAAGYAVPRRRDEDREAVRSTACPDCTSLVDADGMLKEGAFGDE